MDLQLYESELKVMEVLWERGNLTAKEISNILKEEIGWNINTTYTVIKKCIAKGIIERSGKNFMCKALVKKEQVQMYKADELIGRMFNGSKMSFMNTFLKASDFTEEELKNIKKIIDKMD